MVDFSRSGNCEYVDFSLRPSCQCFEERKPGAPFFMRSVALMPPWAAGFQMVTKEYLHPKSHT